MDIASQLAFLQGLPLLSGMRGADLNALAHDFHSRTYDKKETVFNQGDYGGELYLLVQGKVRVFRTSYAGNETSIAIFGPGDVIGEFAVLDDLPRSATAVAIERSTLLATPRDTFLQRMHEMPTLAINVSRMLAVKLRWTASYAEAIAQYDAAGRLLHILLSYNEQFGKEIEPGKRYRIDLAMDQAALASLVGASREWVNRLLQVWRKQGLVEFKSGELVILDLPRVERERDSHIEALADVKENGK